MRYVESFKNKKIDAYATSVAKRYDNLQNLVSKSEKVKVSVVKRQQKKNGKVVISPPWISKRRMAELSAKIGMRNGVHLKIRFEELSKEMGILILKKKKDPPPTLSLGFSESGGVEEEEMVEIFPNVKEVPEIENKWGKSVFLTESDNEPQKQFELYEDDGDKRIFAQGKTIPGPDILQRSDFIEESVSEFVETPEEEGAEKDGEIIDLQKDVDYQTILNNRQILRFVSSDDVSIYMKNDNVDKIFYDVIVSLVDKQNILLGWVDCEHHGTMLQNLLNMHISSEKVLQETYRQILSLDYESISKLRISSQIQNPVTTKRGGDAGYLNTNMVITIYNLTDHLPLALSVPDIVIMMLGTHRWIDVCRKDVIIDGKKYEMGQIFRLFLIKANEVVLDFVITLVRSVSVKEYESLDRSAYLLSYVHVYKLYAKFYEYMLDLKMSFDVNYVVENFKNQEKVALMKEELFREYYAKEIQAITQIIIHMIPAYNIMHKISGSLMKVNKDGRYDNLLIKWNTIKSYRDILIGSEPVKVPKVMTFEELKKLLIPINRVDIIQEPLIKEQ